MTSKARDVVEISWNEISRPARRAVLPGPTSTIALHGKKRERERREREEEKHGTGREAKVRREKRGMKTRDPPGFKVSRSREELLGYLGN